MSTDLTMREFARAVRRSLYRVRKFSTPKHLACRMRSLTPEQTNTLARSLKTHYFTLEDYFPDPPDTFLATDDGRLDMQNHVNGRLTDFRTNAIPWIDSFIDLKGKRILEVGCGTGSATVALSEQGAEVVATDIDNGSVQAAKTRLSLFGLAAEFQICNAVDLVKRFASSSFDVVALFAVLEHMTLSERLKAIADCWKLTKPGGFMIVIETPNRLWVHDSHTSQDHFFMWLPDDLAVLWSRHTSRLRFNSLFSETLSKDEAELLLARWGRGVSYHDFALAIGCSPEALPVESCLGLFYRNARNEHRIYAHTWWRRYEELLQSFGPDIHRGFFLEHLNLSFRRPLANDTPSRPG
jgi:2-polyprenyl-3-methyl-5-hydroxy-6-metoxy-1,4-benzoquinol methylase